MEFRYWFFNQLPLYFKRNDSYKDIADRGLLERYLEIYGLELDEYYINKITNFLDIRDPYTVDTTSGPDLLNYLSYEKGTPPDLWGVPDIYRSLVAFVHRINAIRGSWCSYLYLFRALNLEVTLTEHTVPDVRWDDGTRWDDTDVRWDTNCPKCAEYSINFHYINFWEVADPTVISEELEEVLLKLICWIQPAGSKFREFVFDDTAYPELIDFESEDFDDDDFE